MVNRINGNDYYDYSQLKMPDAADKMENGEKFSLDYQRTQEEPEKKDKDKSDGNGEAKGIGVQGQRNMMQGGVRLELSGDGLENTYARNREKGRTQEAGQGILDMVRSWIAAFVRSAKDFFYKVWNDAPPAVEQIEGIPKEGEKLSEEYLALNPSENPKKPESLEATPGQKQFHGAVDQDKEIQKYLRSGNLDQVISLLTENGHKTMAKNSTLLTYYDRSGRIAPLSASDQERILHGDRNVRKL